MSKLQKHLQKETENLRLTEAEKSAMRLRLRQAMLGVPTEMPTKSPYQWIVTPHFLAMLSIALLLIVSSGTAYAAEGSLPGGVLYPVKIHVIEPLTVALAPSPAAKAEANATIATTRVKEAETLAAQGNLTPQAAREISTNYNEHVTAALALAADADATTATTTSPIVSEATTTPRAVKTISVILPVATSSATHTAAFSARMAVSATASEATSSPDATTTATSAPAVAAEATSTTSTLVGKLHASLSVQAKILDKLNAEVKLHTSGEQAGDNLDTVLPHQDGQGSTSDENPH